MHGSSLGSLNLSAESANLTVTGSAFVNASVDNASYVWTTADEGLAFGGGAEGFFPGDPGAADSGSLTEPADPIDGIPMDPTIDLPPQTSEDPGDSGSYTPGDQGNTPADPTGPEGAGQDHGPTSADEVVAEPSTDAPEDIAPPGIEPGDSGEPAEDWLTDDSGTLWSGWICACTTMMSPPPIEWAVLSVATAEPMLTGMGDPTGFQALTPLADPLSTQVPVPGTLLLIPTGLLGLSLLRRRR